MKKLFVSKTRSGKWAVGLGIVLVVSMTLSLLFAIVIGGDPDVVANSPLLSILAATLSAIFSLTGPLSFFVGIYTIIKYKDRSIWKPLAILYALTVLMFLLGEFSFPH